jgi:hypothetical protein
VTKKKKKKKKKENCDLVQKEGSYIKRSFETSEHAMLYCEGNASFA